MHPTKMITTTPKVRHPNQQMLIDKNWKPYEVIIQL